MIVHQSNHRRIQELKQTTDALDETLRKTIQLLADTRKDILAIPSSITVEGPRREIEVDGLLAYAKFISKTTVPPTSRKQDPPTVPVKREETNTNAANGIETPLASGHVQDHTQDSGEEVPGMKTSDDNGGKSSEPLNGVLFVPWPSQELIQYGALGHIQRMIDNRQDPASVLTEDQQAERDMARKSDEEKARLAQEEADRHRMSMFDTGVVRRPTVNDIFDPDNL